MFGLSKLFTIENKFKNIAFNDKYYEIDNQLKW